MLSLIPLPYRILGALGGLLLLTGGAWLHGYRTADRSATIAAMAKEMADIQAQRDEWLRQARASNEIAKAAAERQREAEAKTTSMEAEIEDYAKALAALPDCGCSLSSDDVRRLRSLTAPGGSTPRPAGAPLDIRPAGPGSAVPHGR